MISRSFERPERTASRASNASNRYRMRHIGPQDASASCLVSAHDRILGAHTSQEPARVGSFLSLVSASNSDAEHLGVAIGGDLGDGSGVQRRVWCLLLLLEVGAARCR